MREQKNKKKTVSVRRQKVRKNQREADLFCNTGVNPVDCGSFCTEIMPI